MLTVPTAAVEPKKNMLDFDSSLEVPFPGILNQSAKMLTDFSETVETGLHPCLNR